MPIVKTRGIIPENRKYRLGCPNCLSVVEYEAHETITLPYEEGVFLKCAVCFKCVSTKHNSVSRF